MLIKSQFNLVEQIKAKYSIYNKDVYNFNKASFIIDKIITQLIIIVLEKRRRLKAIQLDNCKQVIVITVINTASQLVLLFLVFTSQYYLSIQYKKKNILRNQVIVVSNNSQINNKLEVEQLKHFNAYIKTYIISAYYLLILNSYKSYYSLKF